MEQEMTTRLCEVLDCTDESISRCCECKADLCFEHALPFQDKYYCWICCPGFTEEPEGW